MQTLVATTALRTIYVFGEICSAMSNAVISSLDEFEQSDGDIRIVLDSEGGTEQDGYAIYDAIRGCRNKVVVDGYGSVMSIAAIIFQAGDERRLSKHAQFMIHNGTTAELGETPTQDLITTVAERIRRDNQRYYRILSEASGQSRDTIEEWCAMESYFFAAEAVAAGFADSVIEPVKRFKPKKKRKR